MSDSSGSPGSSGFAGFLAPLRALADSGLELLRVRLELLGNELEEQKVRITEGLLLAMLGAMLIALAALLVCLFVLVMFWDGYRLQALGVMTVLVVGAGVMLLQAGRRRLRSSGAMFQASLEELRQDRETLARRPAAAGADAPGSPEPPGRDGT